VWTWVASYVLIPVVGAVLATLVYLVLRAGLLPSSGASGDPYGFAAVAALVGMFSSQAASKLKDVFETLFAKAEPGSDSLEATIAIGDFAPASGKVGDPVTITGTGLQDVDTVEFGGGATAEATYSEDSGGLSTRVPEEAVDGRLVVRAGSQEVRSAEEFKVQG